MFYGARSVKMANNPPQAGTATAAGNAATKDTYDSEERLEDGMEQLKELHLQVRSVAP